MELDVLPVNLYKRYTCLWPDAAIQDCSPMVRKVRAVKSAYEIDMIRQAAGLADRMAGFAATNLREGIPEIEMAGLLEAEARRLGHQGIVRMRLWGSEMFYGHFLSGWSAAVPGCLASPTGGAAMSPAFGQGSGPKKIEAGEPILFDYVFARKGYLADHTRIYCIGELPENLAAGHDAMLELQALVSREALPGRRCGDIYDLALDFVKSKGYANHFMGADDGRVSFIAHGIGLELDEFPFIAAGQKMRLQAGMVLAMEPKLIFPSQGVVGIENTFLVTKDGLERLTRFQDGIVTL
jgi:Xaa-Pro aminopeptidase